MNIVMLEDIGAPKELLEKNIAELKELGHNFTAYSKDDDPTVQEERIKYADVVMLANMPLSKTAIINSVNLKFIDVAFTGVDLIPVQAAKDKEIKISNASGYATQAVAELCVAFMTDLLRNIIKAQQATRNGGSSAGFEGRLLCGKTVGIIGAGAIGRRVADIVKAYGCEVIAENRSPITYKSIDAQVSLEELLKKADIVSIHCPLTDETRGIIGKKELDLMKNTAYLINTARGAIVDQQALADALSNNVIAGAACDVFDTEPPLKSNYPLLNCPNIIVTPHIGYYTYESMEKRAEIAFENLFAWLEGKQINAV